MEQEGEKVDSDENDKMSNLALHRRLKRIETLLAAIVAVLAGLGYIFK